MNKYSTMKKAVKTLMSNGVDVEMAFYNNGGIDDPLNVICRHVSEEVGKALMWAYRALQWAGFQDSVTPAYEAPAWAYEYCEHIRPQYAHIPYQPWEAFLSKEQDPDWGKDEDNWEDDPNWD